MKQNPLAPTTMRRRDFLGGFTALSFAPLSFITTPVHATPFQNDAGNQLYETVFKNFNLTETQEAQFGRELEKSMIALSGGAYLNRMAQAALEDFAFPLFEAARKKLFTWNITLIDNETPSAWILPGGRIGLNKGLLRYTATPDQLATVIAHEIGHADRSHLVARMRMRSFADTLPQPAIDALLSETAERNSAGIMASSVIRTLRDPIFRAITRGYSLDQEQAADDHIALLFRQTGHDLAEGSDIFGTIERLIAPDRRGRNCLFNGHGTAIPRIARLQGLAQNTLGNMNRNDPLMSRGFGQLKATFPTRTHYRLHPLADQPAPLATDS